MYFMCFCKNTTPLLGHIYKESGSKHDITIAALVSGISSGHRILQIQLFDIRSFSLETVSVCDVTKTSTSVAVLGTIDINHSCDGQQVCKRSCL